MGNLRRAAPMAQVSSTINQITEQKGLLFRDAFENLGLSKTIQKYYPEFRERAFGPATILFAFLSQMLSPDKSCTETVARINADRVVRGLKPVSPDNSGYCKARLRMPEPLLHELTTATSSVIENKVPEEWLWKGRSVKLIDGSTATMADTPENRAEYPQHGRQEVGVGFPITRMMAVFSLATGCVLDFVNGPYKGKGTGEHGLLHQLMHCFQVGDIVIGDALFPSYFLISIFNLIGVDCLFASDGKRDMDFRTGEHLGMRDHVASWKKPHRPDWMSKDIYDQMPDSLQVGECTVRVDRPGYRSISVTLVTSLLDKYYAPKEELGWLYSQRWAAELNLAAVKTVLKMEHLRSKTPEMVRKEIWATLLAYNLIRKLIGEAAHQNGLLPAEISFKGAVQNLNAFRPLWCIPGINVDGEVFQILLLLIAKRKVANRPGRIEPRAIKKRPRTFPRLHLPRAKAREKIMKNRMR